ncbi:hypothetical protein ACFSQ0_06295 [Mesonia sediminis]|uniref:DUF1328 domain-containing protein n=1 Tax=Mesonia sediminis TaxID=1703946 RepID=A0ABW5SD40_9FLAO
MQSNRFLPIYFIAGAFITAFIGAFFEPGNFLRYVFYGLMSLFWIIAIALFFKYMRKS